LPIEGCKVHVDAGIAMTSSHQEYRQVTLSVPFQYRSSCVNPLPSEICLQESNVPFLEWRDLPARQLCVAGACMYSLDMRMQASAA
jgi:hypothetical protein